MIKKESYYYSFSILERFNFNISKTIFYFLFIALIIFFEPQLFKEDIFLNVDKIYKILKILICCVLGIMYIKNNKFSLIFIIMLIFQIMAFISTIINNGDIIRFAGPAMTTLAMIIIAELLLESKKYFDMLNVLLYYFRFCFILNILSIFIIDFTNIFSVNNLYFLGIDNRWIFTYFPWILCEFLVAKHNNSSKIKPLMFLLLSELTFLYSGSMAALLLSVLWVIAFYDFKKPIKAIYIFIGTIIVNISFIFIKIQNLFRPILNKIGKDVTLSGRIHLWNGVIDLIKYKPLLGNGMQTVEYDKMFFGSTVNPSLPFLRVVHAHNSYMTILYRQGIVGLTLFIYILFLVFKKLQTNKTNKYYSILLTAIVISLLLAIFDTFDCSGFYFLIGTIYSINKLEME